MHGWVPLPDNMLSPVVFVVLMRLMFIFQALNPVVEGIISKDMERFKEFALKK